ncbi:MAG: glycosyltransferase family 2 protein [Ferruginibacter sp.]
MISFKVAIGSFKGRKTILNNGIKNLISFTKSYLLRLSIIIVNYNVKYFLEQCLCSVINACQNIDAEIFVVDNNSTDGSKIFFEERFSRITFIWSPVNSGFGRANNLALQKAVGEYILFLNPDTILPEDCLEKSLSFFQGQQDVGALGVRMIDGSGKFLKESKRAFPAPLPAFYKLSGLTALFPHSKIFARYYLGGLDQYKSHEVDVLAGAFMMVKKSVLDTTGGFDERFFLYGEDVDLSYRIRNAGFRNYYFSGTTVIHFKGESINRHSLKYLRLFYGAMSLFARKHYRSGIARLYNALIQVAIGLKALHFGIGQLLRRVFAGTIRISFYGPCFIIAEKGEYDRVKSILEKSNRQQQIIGRINPHQSKEEDSMGNITQLAMLVARHKAKEIICCVNGFAAKEMIAILQDIPTGMVFKIHFAGTVSIVGSSNEKTSGDYITNEHA